MSDWIGPRPPEGGSIIEQALFWEAIILSQVMSRSDTSDHSEMKLLAQELSALAVELRQLGSEAESDEILEAMDGFARVMTARPPEDQFASTEQFRADIDEAYQRIIVAISD